MGNGEKTIIYVDKGTVYVSMNGWGRRFSLARCQINSKKVTHSQKLTPQLGYKQNNCFTRQGNYNRRTWRGMEPKYPRNCYK
jgi:hypothetical protein